MNKPTALDKALDLAWRYTDSCDTNDSKLLDDAREELRLLRELARCHLASDEFWHDASPEHQEVLRAGTLQSRNNYRAWRAKQDNN